MDKSTANQSDIIAKIKKEIEKSCGKRPHGIFGIKSKKKKAEIIARIKQNIKLCNKNKLKMKFIALKEENNRDKIMAGRR